MPEASSFDYAVIRVVPRVEREEFMNVGVILFCRSLRFLDIRTHVNHSRLKAFAEGINLDRVAAELDLMIRICRGEANSGPIGQQIQAERFHWLTAPRSTTVQISAVHCGICTQPQATLDSLFEQMVVSV